MISTWCVHSHGSGFNRWSKQRSTKHLCAARGKSHFFSFGQDTKNVRLDPLGSKWGNLLLIFLPDVKTKRNTDV